MATIITIDQNPVSYYSDITQAINTSGTAFAKGITVTIDTTKITNRAVAVAALKQIMDYIPTAPLPI